MLQAVMILQGKEPTWAEAKRQLGERQHGAAVEGWMGGDEIGRRDGREIDILAREREGIGSAAKKRREKTGEYKALPKGRE